MEIFMDGEKQETSGIKSYRSGNSFYRIFETDREWIAEREQNVLWFREHPLFSPKVQVTFYDNGYFMGYEQEVVENFGSFRDYVEKHDVEKEDAEVDTMSMEQKKKLVASIYDKLKKLHSNGVFVGDLTMDRVIFGDEEAYFTKLDEMRYPGINPQTFGQSYLVRPVGASSSLGEVSAYTDNVKACVASLSFMYNFDFEELVHGGVLKVGSVKDCVDALVEDEQEKEGIFKVLDSTEPVVYLDDVLNKTNEAKK